ncbi:hypothetical protein EWM64_g6605 [Hericium alpestre]|uniref:Uncharacterized protein n=1 Tax=Hericium alpestre TaxID=135208 RepID=A0A4Y9ZS49_9AGAM|nr:hypothetical protein EWM64_g6605 [Hericium alpestre]
MAEDIPSDAGALSMAPTVASVLGIKGHLRFRAHGSSQKAHVVLRRVELDDSEDEGEGKPAFYFSLFAQKRIEVKPGKEILLTVADGPFKDQAIMFEGDIPGVASGSDEEETQVAEDEENFAAQEQSMPPKMRKPWVKRTEEPAIAASPILAPPTHHSVGVQAQAEFASFSTQTTFDGEGEIRVREPLQTGLDDNMTDKYTPMELSPIQSVQELAPVETVASTLTIRSAEMEQVRVHEHLILARPPPASVTAAPKPVRRKIPNPFVSGGFMTDFVGLSSASTSKPSTPLADRSPGPAFTSATGTSATPVDRASSAPTSPIAPPADIALAPVSPTSSHAPSVPPPVPPTVAPVSAHPAPALVPATAPAASVSATVPDFTSPAFTESLRSALSALVSAQATPVQESASPPTSEVSAPQVQSDVKREPSPLTISPSFPQASRPALAS